MRVEVIAAAADEEPVLANLFELYAHDFSELTDLRLGPDGRFGFDELPLYWTDAARRPFLIKADGDLAGFVLVQKGSQISGDADVWDVAEFFVARGYRRDGVGTRAAHEVWRRLPGRWEVRVLDRNEAARAFWQRAVAGFTGAEVDAFVHDREGRRWHVFSFDTR
jgi:predicted acetyltransferase